MVEPVHQYRLEPARAREAALLAAMARELVEGGLRPSWDASRITWHIRHPESVVLAARAGSALAGFAIMRYADDSAHLNLLAVAPAHRRRGIARRLVAWLESTALTAGTFSIGLELRAGNAAARAFYAALGYRELGCVPGYYQGVESAIRMGRDLRRDQDSGSTR
ncbi:MAG TPA: GNAT family N-acetyltransferase [Steroidobacteraceae bacterium]|jgi:ribosomal-protein-alanine N-acetyltransferase|nr:GNAT family N-acetyltransferase [Steroidobacteraceae bacterium]